MATTAKNVQIRLNPSNPRDKQVIDYLAMMGRNSGEAKRLFMAGFFGEKENKITTDNKPQIKKEPPQVDNINMDFLAG